MAFRKRLQVILGNPLFAAGCVALTLCCFVLSPAADSVPSLLERSLLDLATRVRFHLRLAKPIHKDIRLLPIDAAAANALGKAGEYQFIADVITQASYLGADVIALEASFQDPSAAGPLLDAIRPLKSKVVLGRSWPEESPGAERSFPWLESRPAVDASLKLQAESGRAIRRYALVDEFAGTGPEPSLALATYLVKKHIAESEPRGHTLTWEDTKSDDITPVTRSADETLYHLNYRTPLAQESPDTLTFQRFWTAEALATRYREALAKAESGQADARDTKPLGGKVLFVFYEGAKQAVETPFGPEPGIAVQVAALSNLLDGTLVRSASRAFSIGATLAFFGLWTLLAWIARRHSLVALLVCGAFLCLVVLGIGYRAFDQWHFVLPTGQTIGWLAAGWAAEAGRRGLYDVAYPARMTLQNADFQVPGRVRTLERILNQTNPFLNVAVFGNRMQRAWPCVCRIDIGGNASGTGFLIAPDLVLTNYHVIEDLIGEADAHQQVSCRFAYVHPPPGETNKEEIAHLAVNWCPSSSPYHPDELEVDLDTVPEPDQLDYAILQLAAPMTERGFIPFPVHDPEFPADAPLMMLEHPGGEPLKLAIETRGVVGLNANGTRVRYCVNTTGGSSGSPCFDMEWNLVALHHRAGPPGVDSYNQGIPVAALRHRFAQAGVVLPPGSSG